MKNSLMALASLALLSTFNSQLSTVLAQGTTAFMYQGQLVSGGVPANGSYDLTFTLFATNTSGVPIAGPVTNSATAVSNGLFIATIDFGGVFTGTNYWLELAVQTNGGSGFTTLSPRQPISPTPYSIYSANAGSAATSTTASTANSVEAADITGTILPAQLPAALVTNTETGVTLSGTFSGNGGGLTNLNASQLSNGVVPTSILPGFQSPNYETVGGGSGNVADNLYAVVGGGFDNTASYQSTVGGGGENNATGFYATIPGGNANLASGNYSFAAGQQAQATNQGAFVWADSQNAPFTSTNNDSFNVRAQGGVRFVTSGAGMTVNGQPVLAGNNGGGLTNLNAAQLSSGVIPLAQLPAVVVTNNSSSLTLSGAFNGNGGGLTNLNASQLTSIGNTNGGSENFYLGSAGNAATTGSYNTALGYHALFVNTNGSYNTANGVQALLNNTSGNDNTANGVNALYFNTSGYDNTAIGVGALLDNTSGSYNIALGYQAGYNITTGSSDIDIGSPGVSTDTNIIRIGTSQTITYIAGTINGDGGGLTNLNVSASQLTSIGNTNGGSENFYLGSAGNAATTGSYNTANGVDALLNNTSGYANTANGYLALFNNTNGYYNTANGVDALFHNTSGSYNTANGVQALLYNTSGNDNTANGVNALYFNTSGYDNTAIGFEALLNNASGSNNIALGYRAGYNIMTGSGNIDIGNLGVSTDTNIIRIGTSQATTYIAGVVNDMGGVQVGNNGTAMTTIESGQSIMPSASTVETNFTITFPTAFSSSPKIVFSLANDPGYQGVSDIFAGSISSNSPAAFSINVYRLNGTGWSQSLRINWQAWQ